jgi:hypothetical protein
MDIFIDTTGDYIAMYEYILHTILQERIFLTVLRVVLQVTGGYLVIELEQKLTL